MKLVFCVCLAIQLFVVESKVITDLPEPCHRSDPNFKKCFISFINSGLALLRYGAPQYHIPPSDPYRIPILSINTTYRDFVTGMATFKNIKVSNALKIKINDVKYDFKNSFMELDLTHPKLNIELEYLFDGKVLGDPVHAEGSFKGKLVLISSNLKFKFSTIKKDGIDHLTLEDFKLNTHIEDGSIQILSKNPQEQTMVDIIQNSFNRNARLYLDLLTSNIVKGGEKRLRALFQRYLDSVPASRLIAD